MVKDVEDPGTVDWLNPGEREPSSQELFLDRLGRERNDGIPMEPPLGYVKQPSMVEHIRNMVRSEMLKQAVEAQGYESFEESEDFEVGDDYDPSSPYEIDEEDTRTYQNLFHPKKPAEGEGVGGGGSPEAPATPPATPDPGVSVPPKS